jgi:hypothetical protein
MKIFGKPTVWLNGERTDLAAPPLNGATLADDLTLTFEAPGMAHYLQWIVNAQDDPVS